MSPLLIAHLYECESVSQLAKTWPNNFWIADLYTCHRPGTW